MSWGIRYLFTDMDAMPNLCLGKSYYLRPVSLAGSFQRPALRGKHRLTYRVGHLAQHTETSETFTRTESRVHWPTGDLLSEPPSLEKAPGTLNGALSALTENPSYLPSLNIFNCRGLRATLITCAAQ
jgi:hypothetical protein